jgi:hypothetical protein
MGQPSCLQSSPGPGCPAVSRWKNHVVARAAVAELWNVGLADDDRAGGPKTLDHHVLLGWHKILVDN